ncbi:MAG: hypothetical protein IJO64_03795 [Clostridia bacterium]|nr:hypothetical protein [Clostridia bacterium]MBQ9848165.1 hypothetical protein [Clostridia bacterium]
MDYREYSKDLLSRKKNLVSAYSVLNTELEKLEQEKYACKTAAINAEATDGEDTVHRERLLGILANIDDCRLRRSVVERELLKIEKGLNGLSDYQRDLLEEFFVERKMGAADDLMERWYKERSSLYRDRNRALEEFTRSIYGVLQL